MISNFFVPKLENVDVNDLSQKVPKRRRYLPFSQQNNLLKYTFELFDLASNIMWFNTAGIFFVGLCEVACLRSSVREKKENIQRVIADIWPQLLQEVVESGAYRLEFIRASRGVKN